MREKSEIPAEVSAATLGELLGITGNRVNALGRDGVLPRVQRGGVFAYTLPDAVVAYVDWARDNPRGRRVKDPALADEKHRLAKEQADKIALQNARARGDLLEASAVRAEWLTVAADLRARLFAVRARIAVRLGLDRATAAALDSELRKALSEIAAEPRPAPARAPTVEDLLS